MGFYLKREDRKCPKCIFNSFFPNEKSSFKRLIFLLKKKGNFGVQKNPEGEILSGTHCCNVIVTKDSASFEGELDFIEETTFNYNN